MDGMHVAGGLSKKLMMVCRDNDVFASEMRERRRPTC